jgi:hypothetical protein
LYCKTNEIDRTASRTTFERSFHNNNLAIFQPRKDLCNTCLSFYTGNITKDEFELHIKKKGHGTRTKENDKANALEGQIIMLTLDVQATKNCPNTGANCMYFKSRLTVHNLTIFNVASIHCKNYWFTETASN